MAIAISAGERRTVVLSCDQHLPEGDPGRTEWDIRTLTRTERARLEDMIRVSDGAISMPLGAVKEQTVRAGLVGCRNFRDADGNEVAFEADKMFNVLGRQCTPPTAKFLDRIHPDHLTELADLISKVSSLTVEEGKD